MAALALLLFLFLAIAGCTGNCSRQERERDFVIDLPEDSPEDLSKVRQVFYSLPSPVETAIILKTSGAVFDEDLLNPVENVSRYLTNRSMALNLGIYTTNLSYASLFDQAQICIDYMDAAKRLADNLGILDAVDRFTLERLEENISNREVVIDIVSETFMNSSSFLQESNREPVAAMLLAGGWLEGLYLALNLIDEDELEHHSMVNIIIDKKLSLEIVMLLLKQNSQNEDVAELMGEMGRIEDLYRKIEIERSPIEVDRSGEDGVTILRSSSSARIERDVFRDLKSTVNEIRNSIVS